MLPMNELKQQILKELDSLETAVVKLRGAAVNAGKQTDLEVAILTEQVKTLREKNMNASEMVKKSVKILKGLK